MLTKIIMPPSGQTTNESTIVRWCKKTGDAVKKGETLFEIETDKATMEIESLGEGVLLAIYHDEGDCVTAGDVVAYVGDIGEAVPGSGYSGKTAGMTDTAVQASPAARRLAKERNVGLEEVAASMSGPGRPLRKKDVERYSGSGYSSGSDSDIGPGPAPGFIMPGIPGTGGDTPEFYWIQATSMRRTIARRMSESVSVAPQFTVTVDTDMTQAILLRNLLNDRLKDEGIRVSFNDLLMKFISRAICKHPLINSTYAGDRLKVYKNVNFGLAVGLEDGLAVPVVRYADLKPISRIAMENAANIEKARNGKLQASDMSGGTVTLSNLGMYGIDRFTAIINQPESCVLAVGRIVEKPALCEGRILAKKMMTVTATFDHRVIDGAAGAVFMNDVRDIIENPQLMLI